MLQGISSEENMRSLPTDGGQKPIRCITISSREGRSWSCRMRTSKAGHKGLFGKQVQNSALGTLQSKLKVNKNVLVIDRFFPSTRMCPCCGTVKEDITLSDRTFVCNSCGYTEDRDVKAAKTLLIAGQHIMSCTLAEYKRTPEERMSGFDTSYEIWKQSAKRPQMGKSPEAPSSSVS